MNNTPYVNRLGRKHQIIRLLWGYNLGSRRKMATSFRWIWMEAFSTPFIRRENSINGRCLFLGQSILSRKS